MSGSRPSVNIRVSTEGADTARRQLEAIGPAGEAAFRRVGTASTAARAPMQALGGASDGLFRSLGALPGPLAAIAQQSGGLASSLGGASLAMGAAAAAGALLGGALAAGLGASVRAAEQFERLSLRTEAVVRATGGAAGYSAGQIRELSQEIARSTLASTEGVEAAAQKLLTFRSVAGETFARTLRAAQDLASIGFGTIESASVQLGKALENPAEGLSALTRVGISFSDAQKKVIEQLVATGRAAEAQAVMLGVVEKQVGGAGKAEAGGLAGAYDTLGQNVQEFLVRIGNAGPIQAATAALNLLAAAIRNVDKATGGMTPREALQQDIAAAQLRLLQAQSKVPNEANIDSSYRNQFDRARVRDQAQQAQAAVRAAESEIRTLNDRLAEIDKEGQTQRFGQFVQSERARLEAQKQAAAARLEAMRTGLEPERAIREAHAKRLQTIDESERLRDISAAEASRLRGLAADDLAKRLAGLSRAERAGGDEARKSADKRQAVIGKLAEQVKAAEGALAMTTAGEAAAREMAIALQIESEIRAAGIPVVEQRTEADRKAAEQIGVNVRRLNELKDAAKKADDEIKRAKAWQEKSWNDLGSIGERAMDRIGDAAVNALLAGEGRAVNFGNVMRGVAMSIAADFAKLALINPFLNWAMPGSAPRSTLSAAMGGGGVPGGFGGFGSMLSSGWGTLSSGGFLAGGGGISGALFGTPGTMQSFSDLGGITANVGGTPGMFGTGGEFSMSSAGATLGGIAAGFGIGSTIGGFIANSNAQRQNSQIGAAVGSAVGAVFGPLGSIIGGMIGGAGGGLIGPKDTVNAWGYWLESQDGALKPIGRQWYNEAGAQQFAYADQQVAAVNAMMQAGGLTVTGSRNVGGNKNGPDGRWGGAASFEEAFADLRFASADNAQLNAALSDRSFAGTQALADFVDGFRAIEEVIRQLTADAVPAYTASILAVNDNFAAVRAEADRLGASMEGLAEAQAKAIAEIEQARTETLRQSGVALGIRMMAATGRTQEAELARQAEAARQEIEAFGRALDALAITAEDRAARLVQLEETQAAERAAIIQRWGEQAAAALRQAGGTIRAYLDSLETGTAAGASPTDRFAAAQEQFERDRILSMGGDRDALGRITGTADALLSAGRDMYASAPEYQAVLDAVKAGLGGLPVLQSYDAMQAASLEAIQAAIESGTLNTATTIVPGGNIVQVANMADLAGLAAAISGLIDTSLQVGGATHAGLDVLAKIAHDHHATAVQQAAGIISLGVYLAAANDFLNAANWRLNHLVQLGEATNGSVATGAATNVAALGALTKVTADGAGAGVTAQNVTNIHLVNGFTVLHAVGSATNTHLVNGFTALHAVGALTATNATAIGNAHSTALGSLNTNTTASLAALNKITVDGNAAVVTSLALSNTLLAGILAKPVPVANDNRLIDINTSLATVDKSIRDVNTSLATVHGSVVAAGSAGVLAQNAGNVIAVDVSAAAMQARAVTNTHLAAILAATQAGTAHGLVTAGQIQVVGNHAHSAVLHIATHQQYTLQGNARIAEARDAQLAGNTLAAAQIARLLDLNASLATVDKSVRDVNTSLATVDARVAAVMLAQNAGNTIATSIGNAHTTALGSLNTNTTASLAALNKITVDGNAAVVTSLALSNTLLAGILGKPVPVANDNRLIDINTSLATVDKSVRDVNASLATVHGSVVAAGAAGVLAQNAGNVIAVDVSAAAMQARAVTNTHLAAILAATQAGTAHGLVTAGQIQVVGNHAHSAVLHIATHQQYTLQNTQRVIEARDAQLAGNTLAAAQIARLLDLNASLATVDKSVRDVNASLATVDARVAAVMLAQNAGNTIAVDAAGSLTAGFAGLTTVTVDSNAGLLAALNAGNLIAVDAAGAAVAAQNAGNLITAVGADATVAALNAGNTIQATYYGQNMAQMQALIAEMQAMRAELAQLRNVTQQGAVLTANETRTGALLVAAKVEQVDDTLRKNAA